MLDVLSFPTCGHSHCVCVGTPAGTPVTACHPKTDAQATPPVNSSQQALHTTGTQQQQQQQQQSQPTQLGQPKPGASSAAATTAAPPSSTQPLAVPGSNKENPIMTFLAALHNPKGRHIEVALGVAAALFVLLCVVGAITLLEYCAGSDVTRLGRFLAIIATALTLFLLLFFAGALVEECEWRTAELQRLLVRSTEQKPGTEPSRPRTQAQPNAQFPLQALNGALCLFSVIFVVLTAYGLLLTLPLPTPSQPAGSQTSAHSAMPPSPPSTAPATPAPPHTCSDIQSALASTQAELTTCKGRVSGLEWSLLAVAGGVATKPAPANDHSTRVQHHKVQQQPTALPREDVAAVTVTEAVQDKCSIPGMETQATHGNRSTTAPAPQASGAFGAAGESRQCTLETLPVLAAAMSNSC
jgi:hypothetical protein